MSGLWKSFFGACMCTIEILLLCFSCVIFVPIQVGLSADTPFLFNCSETQWPTLLFQLPPVHARVPALRVSIQVHESCLPVCFFFCLFLSGFGCWIFGDCGCGTNSVACGL